MVRTLAAAAGSHFRSLVVGCRKLKGNNRGHSTLDLTSYSRANVSSHLTLQDQIGILDYMYVKLLVRGDECAVPKEMVEAFVDADGNVSTPLLFTAFDKQRNFDVNKHPVLRFFEQSAFVDAAKQHEHSGMYFDVFRALYRFPVLRNGVKIQNSSISEADQRHLRFPEEIACNAPAQGSILTVVESRTTDGKQKQSVQVAKDWRLSETQYMLPSASNHPYIDRACVVASESNKYLLIFQDKINGTSFSAAVRDLNKAATMLKEKVGLTVICVAQVVQASPGTKAQTEFEHPYILVRGREVETFYSKVFKTGIDFCIERHNKSGSHSFVPGDGIQLGSSGDVAATPQEDCAP